MKVKMVLNTNLVEDLTTGDIRITKDRPGVAVYGCGMRWRTNRCY